MKRLKQNRILGVPLPGHPVYKAAAKRAKRLTVTIATLRAVAARFAGTIEERRADGEYSVEAITPAGIVWASDDLHVLLEATADDLAEWRNAARAALFDRITWGTRPCESPDCDTCHPEHDANTCPDCEVEHEREREEAKRLAEAIRSRATIEVNRADAERLAELVTSRGLA